MQDPISITERAAEEIKQIFEKKNIPENYKLRVTVRGGRGCMAVALTLGFDKQQEDDVSYEIKAIPVIIQKRELMYIAGQELDFYEGADARGFHFAAME